MNKSPYFSSSNYLPDTIEYYLVGGAVRDLLLNYPIKEKDWVVVGTTPEQMLALGFEQVGKDFPVFLHPQTKEEYALARTERKSGRGYHGFLTNSLPSVSLTEDLYRRDLTINAMAQDKYGQLIDPYHGQHDLQAKILRHVSEAFIEDPLRVLRVARFAARYHHLGFKVADETMTLMQQINTAGELKYLTIERVWKETSRALMEKNPQIYFQVLLACSALKTLMPEIAALNGIEQPAKHHPEIDCFVHACLALEYSAKANHDLATRYAVLVHDLGKATTPKNILPQHIGHEQRSEQLVRQLNLRLKVPNDCAKLAIIVAKWHTHCHKALELKPQTLLKVLSQIDAYRKPERFLQFLNACEADARGRTGFENRDYVQKNYFQHAFNASKDIDIQTLIKQGFTGKKLGEAIQHERLNKLKAFKQNYLTQD